MMSNPLRIPLVFLCAAGLTFGSVPVAAPTESPPVSGSIAGKVFDEKTDTPLPGVAVRAHAITANAHLEGVETEEDGSFLILAAPPAVYAFTLSYEGKEYEIPQRFDARADMRFLLEGCFQLDRPSGTATLLEDCRSGFVPEAQVVSLGPERYFRPDSGPTFPTASLVQEGPSIAHSRLQCWPYDRFPIAKAGTEEPGGVESARLYFRAEQARDHHYIEATRSEDAFQWIGPMAQQDTQWVHYYVELISRAFGTSRTEEYRVPVMSAEECSERDPAAAYFTGTPTITVFGVGAPVGFQ
ncbi:MAG: hypothetical protein ACE5JL_13395, partial [Dehalococcoidia bacterium]